MMSAFEPMVLLRFCGQFRLARNPIFLVQSGQFGLGLPRPLLAESGLLIQRFAENLTAAILPKAAAKLELR